MKKLFIFFGVYGEGLLFFDIKNYDVLSKPNSRCPKEQFRRLLFLKNLYCLSFSDFDQRNSDSGEKKSDSVNGFSIYESRFTFRYGSFLFLKKAVGFSFLELELEKLEGLGKNYQPDCEKKSFFRIPNDQFDCLIVFFGLVKTFIYFRQE